MHPKVNRFVTTGKADADATMSMWLMSGQRPKNKSIDLGKLVGLVDRMDTDPIGTDLLDKGIEGAMLLLWNQAAPSFFDAMAFYGGIDRWRWIFSESEKRLQAYLEAAKAIEKMRFDLAKNTELIRISESVAVALPQENFFGFDVWYQEYPVVIEYKRAGVATVACPNKAVAERLFGQGGLMNIFSHLKPPGWGGREYVGGSPRGMRITRKQVEAAAKVIASLVIDK